ncbi:hypothetical protein [Klebsiella phage vB_KpnS-VAC51]|uniref:Uncharacterized protein n=2 Tax=Viruses TaxID=10239 RepID=A0AAE9C6T4_9CAUD|nr:hypothetical protein [Klebsiella phage vB_KpnS-VAC51]BEH89479.1 hypothetical protein [Klebsiella phage phiKp_27]
MSKRSIAAIIVFSMMYSGVSLAADRNKVEISDNGRVRVTTNGITKEAGKFRKSETRFGETKIYTNKTYGKPAVTLDRYGRQVEDEDDSDE